MIPVRTFFLILFCCATLFAQDVRVSLEIDRDVMTLEDDLQIRISVEGGDRNVSPQLKAEGFDLGSTGTSSQISIINGRMTSQMTYTYSFQARTAGKFVVGPATVDVGGKRYSSEVRTVTVEKTPGMRGGAATTQEKFFYLVTDVDNKTPYLNQQITYTFQFFNRAHLANANLKLPDFTGFIKEELQKQREFQRVVGGIQWNVVEFKYALFPVSEGKLTIPAAELTADAVVSSGRQRNDPFFDDFPFFGGRQQMKRINLRSLPNEISATKVPTQGMPANYSGLIGQFSLKQSIGKQNLGVGESTTQTIVVEGLGGLKGLTIPETPLKGVKIYDDKPQFENRIANGKVWNSKTFKRAIVPLSGGQIEVAGVQIPYFDPVERAFRTLTAQPVTLNVSGTTEQIIAASPGQKAQIEKQKVEVLGQDLMPIKRALGSTNSQELRAEDKILYALALLFFPLLYGLAIYLKRRRDARDKDTTYEARSRAFKVFSGGLKKLKPGGSFPEEASLLLRGYLGDRFSVDGKALTSADMKRVLQSRVRSPQLVQELEQALKKFERAQFGGETLEMPEQEAFKIQLSKLVGAVEKEAGR